MGVSELERRDEGDLQPTLQRPLSAVGLSQVKAPASLIDSRFDHDSCGVGFVASALGKSNHQILQHALTALSRLEHRGAVAADGASSDGIGLMTAVPRALLLADTGVDLNPEEQLGVGMVFCSMARREPKVCSSSVCYRNNCESSHGARSQHGLRSLERLRSVRCQAFGRF